jgi:hypothetical protein
MGEPALEISRSLEVAIGAPPLAIDVPAGRIEGVLPGADPTATFVFLAWERGGLRAQGRVRPDASGRFVFALAPAGRCRVVRSDTGAGADVEVAPDAKTSVRIP